MKKSLILMFALLLSIALSVCTSAALAIDNPATAATGEINLLNLGDSIASASGANGGYAKIIADKHGMILTSRARGGAYIANVGENNLHIQIAASIAAGDKPDYVLFNGMTNDMHISSGIQLGEITDGYNAALDESTFCGGMESACKKLISSFPGAKILYIRAHNMTRRDATKQKEWGDKAIEICRKWGIDCVDLYVVMDTNVKEIREAYTLKCDGIHPNAEGYAKFYVPHIEVEMLTKKSGEK